MSQQQILGLEITVNQALIMGILQREGHLLEVGDDGLERQPHSLRMEPAQGATRSILHDQKWRTLLHAKVQDAHNMGMAQGGQGTSLAQKAFHLTLVPWAMEQFDGGLGAQMHMLPQVDRPPLPLSQHLDELIGAELLSDMIWHLRTSCLWHRNGEPGVPSL